jgi:hypothetical protein
MREKTDPYFITLKILYYSITIFEFDFFQKKKAKEVIHGKKLVNEKQKSF